MRWVFVFLALFITGCQTAEERAGAGEWQVTISSRLIISQEDGLSEVIRQRQRDLTSGWQEDIRFTDGRVYVTRYYDKYFHILPPRQQQEMMVKPLKKLSEKGYRFDEIIKITDRRDPVFFVHSENDKSACILFTKYTSQKDTAAGYIQTDEHKDTMIHGYQCYDKPTGSKSFLIKRAQKTINRIGFKAT